MTLLRRRRDEAAQACPAPPGAGPRAGLRHPDLTERQQRLVWRIAGLLLEYPDAVALRMTGDLAREAAALPVPAGPALASVCAHLGGTPPGELARGYVETFDLRRRHCLHLTYFAYGDTRKRGMALLRFKHAFREAGAELDEHELPDHLPVVLEFAATVDPVVGRRLLVEYLPVVELLRRALAEAGSPYAGALDAVCATLPPLGAADLRRVAELAAQGPPSEEVGLDGYGMDPALDTELGGRR